MSLWSRVRGFFASSSTVGPMYEGAARGRRVDGFYAPQVGVNAALAGTVEVMRARSHALMRSNPLVWRGLRSYVASLVGTGMMPQSQVKDAAQRRAISQLWSDWDEDANADGIGNWISVQVEAALSLLLTGEVFIRIRPRLVTDDVAVPMQLQVIEADHCPVSLTRVADNGNQIKMGKEFNGIGQCVAYWLTPEHPSDQVGPIANTNEPIRVPADGVLHIYEKVRPGQLRGEPRMARILLTAYHLDQFDDATLEKAKMAAAITAFIKKQMGEGPLLAPGTVANASGEASAAIKIGTAIELNEGEEMQFPPAADVGSYVDFHREGVRTLSAGIGSTYEHTSGDYEGVTYSSLREAKIHLRRECEQFAHSVFTPQFRRIWKAFLRTAMLNQLLPEIPAGEFARNPRPFFRVKWVSSRMDYVDPLKDVTADKEAVKAGFRSVSDVIRSYGEDPEAVFAERAADFAILGKTTDLNPENEQASAAAPVVQPDAPAGQRRRAA